MESIDTVEFFPTSRSIASQPLLSRPKPTGFFGIANPMCSSLFAAFVDHIQILGFSTVQQVKCNSLD